MKIRQLIASLCIFWSFSAAAQVTGEFYLRKPTFAPGEPIFLYFKVSNQGDQPISLNTTNLPGQPFCAGYLINVSGDSANKPLCPQLLSVHSCVINDQFSSVTIAPGKAYTEQIFLNPYGNFRSAGKYTIEATHFELGRVRNSGLSAKVNLQLWIDSHATATADTFQPWVAQLNSFQRRDRMEAARVLAYLAPSELENVVLHFVNNPEFRRLAPLALYNLNTSRSIAALAALAEDPAINEQSEAVAYLARTNDQKWLPMLFQAAQEHAVINSFPSAAAKLGGEKAIPMLVSIEKSSSPQAARTNAVMALGDTGSRAAVPILLEYLTSSETDIAERARYSLEVLTHRTAISERSKKPPQTEYMTWSQWWKRSGETAPMYSATEFCTKRVPLPQIKLASQNEAASGR